MRVRETMTALKNAGTAQNRKGEWVAGCGWAVAASLAMDADRLTDTQCRALLRQIRREITDRPNRVRHEMNNCLIAIGLRTPALRREAESTAKRIGPLDVDHGETSCVTPDAVEYLDRSWKRKEI